MNDLSLGLKSIWLLNWRDHLLREDGDADQGPQAHSVKTRWVSVAHALCSKAYSQHPFGSLQRVILLLAAHKEAWMPAGLALHHIPSPFPKRCQA